MEFRRIWALRGPNVWAGFPVLDVVVDLGAMAGRPIPPDSEGGRSDWAEKLARTNLELQEQAGSPVSFVEVRPSGEAGVFRVAVEFEEEVIAREALEAARRFCLAMAGGPAVDLSAEVAKLKEIAEDVRLGPSTRSIVEAARGRGIPVRRLNEGSLVQLGHGNKQRRIRTAETDRTGAVAEAIAQDKDLTKALLGAVGVPIPEGRQVVDAEDAWVAAQAIGVPVVVKPLDGNHGRGVATDLTTREQVLAAYGSARAEGSRILVEKFIKGGDYRLLVVGGKLVAAARREPARVVGDGASTVAQLVEAVNRDPRRGEGHSSVLTKIRLDDPIARAVLGEQGHSPGSIPAPGEVVLIRRNANLSTGGTAEDVTDRVHPDVASRAVDAARMIGLDIAGVDLVAEDVDRPLEQTGAAVVEVNAGPGLRMHLEPSSGTPRPVGRAIVDMLFPEGENGRIPVVAVTGKFGSTVSRMIALILAASGRRVGLAWSGGIEIGGRRIVAPDRGGAEGARSVLLNPTVDAAVFEVEREGILREGLGFESCDVVVVTELLIEGGTEAERFVVASAGPSGSVVLSATDLRVAEMAEAALAPVTFFAIDPEAPALAEHLVRGGRGAFVRGRELILAEGDRMTSLGDLGWRRVEGSLAAASAAWALGIGPGAIAEALASSEPD